MLVLTRKLQQQIKIGDQITVTILKVKGNTVQIGVDAPRAVRVVRAELPKMNDAAVPAEAAQVGGAANPSVFFEEALASHADLAGETVHERTEPTVISFRVPAAALEQLRTAETQAPTHPAGAHLPLRRLHNRFGSKGLKQIVAASNTLAK
jgi:carbon storage regulator CsrA